METISCNRPLEDVAVLDFSRVLAGPFCSMILGDLGARIIKIEPPGGDDTRQYGPFIDQESAYYMSINRNKESIVLNLKSPEGVDAARKLAAKVDVVLENYRPGTMERLGLGYDTLKKINPRLIYAAVSGFGQTGPWKHKAAYDIIVQGMSGMMSITGNEGGPPVRVGISIGDIAAGLFTAIGILSALYERNKSGKGQFVDVSMLDCQLAILENALARYLVANEIPSPLGTRHPSITPFAAFPSKDGYVLAGMGNDSLWKKFCQSVGCLYLTEDERFQSNKSRTEHWEELEPLLNEIFKTKTTSEWVEFLEAQGIPCGPINTIDKIVKHPQVLARKLLIEVETVGGRTVTIPRIPVMMERTDPDVYKPAQKLGESTRKILMEAGYSQEEIQKMYDSGAVK